MMSKNQTWRGHFLHFILAFGIVGGVGISVGWGGEEIDVSKVTPEPCARCNNSGAEKCVGCGGKGESNRATITCPECKGKGKVPCTKCDEKGKVKCTKCKPGKIGDKKTRVVQSDAFKRWLKAYIDKYGQPPPKGVQQDDMPEMYMECPDCKGEGIRVCPTCNGTKEHTCPKCEGKGTVTGWGPCPDCDGLGKVPCLKCGKHPDIEESLFAEIKDEAIQKKMSVDEYFLKRRLLLAQELYRQQALASRGSGKGMVAKGPSRTYEGPWADAQTRMDIMLSQYRDKAFSIDEYNRRVRALGLPPEVITEMEQYFAKEIPRLAEYVKLQEAFREGEIDFETFLERRGKL